jgi:hypothetical protein
MERSRTPQRVRLASVLVVGALVSLAACSSTSPVKNTSDTREGARFRFPAMDIALVKESVHESFMAAGFRSIEQTPGLEENHLGRTKARRPGSALSLAGVPATADYYRVEGPEGVEFEMFLRVGQSIAIVAKGTWEADLVRKLEDGLRVKYRMHVAAAAKPVQEREEETPSAATAPKKVELPPFTDQRHALIVGISEYQDGNFSNLPRAAEDARALAEFLESDEGGRISSNRIHLLVNDDATRGEILKALSKIGKDQSEQGDMIIMYFAGHGRATSKGDARRYLMAYDSEYSAPEVTGIEKGDVERFLAYARARRQMVFLDCCFAGVGEDEVLRSGAFIEDDPFRSIESVEDDYRTVITSTEGGEVALDSMAGSPNSPFATFLLRALRGDAPEADADRDGRLSAKELHTYLSIEVTQAARERGFDMHPQLFGPGDQEIIQLRER